MQNLTVVVPYWNGEATIGRLLDSLPDGLPVIIVDDHSDTPLQQGDLPQREGLRVVRPLEKGYFSGAVNAGLDACGTDVLVLNQDLWFTSGGWQARLLALRADYAVIGDGVLKHPAWPQGYVQGTFMFLRRDAIQAVGGLNVEEYPLWGSTCEWQLRACRAGFRAHVSQEWRGWTGHDGRHGESGKVAHRRRYGAAITEALKREPASRRLFLRTPPAISVIMPCYNYGRYLEDAINSLVGGLTSLGEMAGQTFQSFEVVIVDDASEDDSWAQARALADPWKGIRAIRLPENRGTPGALNAGVSRSYGEYIHILSADDMREPWCLETLYRACRANPHHVAYGNIRVFADGERKRLLTLPGYDFDLVLRKNPMPAGIMYPRQAWEDAGGYPETMVYGREDWAFNIALGREGWCGFHVGDSGNLYRREKQNRSLRTGNVHKGETGDGFSWRQTFRQQLEALYPELYAGVRPVGCCGGRKGTSLPKPQRGRRGGLRRAADIPNTGMRWVQYVLGNAGNSSWVGEATRKTYIFGGGRPIGQVHNEDYDWFIGLRDKKRKIFVPYRPQAPAVSAAKALQANPMAEPTRSPVELGEVPEPDATPRAAEVAEQMGISLYDVVGTGEEGRILVSDVRAYAGQ